VRWALTYLLFINFCLCIDTEKPLSSVQREEETGDDQLEQASARAAAALQEAADRERQLQMKLDMMKDDLTQLQTRLGHQSNLQTDFDYCKLEDEMKQRDSKCVFIVMLLRSQWLSVKIRPAP